MGDPLSVTTGIISLIALAVKLVVGATGVIDKTAAAHREAANELEDLQRDLELLEMQISQIHDKLQFLATDTKDHALKKLLQDKFGKTAVQALCTALDDTFVVLERLTDRTESEMDTLQSIALPANERSLAYVRALLKHNLSPSKVADLVNNLKRMQSEIRACLDRLERSFGHVNDLYNFSNNRLMRVATSTSIFSTSTTLTARIELVGWLKRREGTWGLSKRSKPTKPCDVFDTDRELVLMPPDILGKVLRHLCSDGPLPLRHVLFVSKGFYDAAVNDAFLWTTISFDLVFLSHFRGRPIEQSNNFIKLCLLRSGVLPLRLCIHIPWEFGLDHLLGPLEIFRNSKYKGFERCTSLVLTELSKVVTQSFVAALPAELPSLQHISLHLFHYDMRKSKFPNCPLLKRVELFDCPGFSCSLCSTTPWVETFAHVTTLSIKISSASAYYALSVSPRLRELTIRAGSTRPLGHSPIRIHLEYLQILRVHGNIPGGMLANFLAPALEELHIEASCSGRTAIDAPWDRFGLCCLHIYALLPETVRDEQRWWATSLSWIVRICTRLETLYISKWMEEDCKRFMGGSIDIVHHVL